MNCKPGDLAVIVRHSEWVGWIVEILSVAPCGDFVAPDGTPFSSPGPGDDWLIKAPRPFLKRPYSRSCYATCPDAALRPLPGAHELDADEMLRPLPVEAT